MDLISVVIPVYNGEKYIRDSVNSILNQTYKNIELIIVDDGSTDRSVSIIKSLNKNIKILKQKNKGQSSALNIGWKNSNGKYLSYLSADDKINSNCFEELISLMDENTSLIYSNFQLIDINGGVIKNIDYGVFNKNKFLEELVCYPASGILFKKKDYDLIGGWNEKLHQIPDFEFWIRLLSIGEFKKCNKTLSQFRVHNESGSFKKISKKRADEILYINKIIGKIYKNVDLNKTVSSAYFISSRHHQRSRRYIRSIYYLIISFVRNPRILINKINRFF